jgi:hypothetical protein
MLATTSSISKSGTKQSQATSLIDGLNSLEETFEVSIAFKDELVIGKLAPSKLKQYPSVEHGLKELLSGTDLDFEKAGKKSYVILKKKIQKQKNRSNDLMPVQFVSTRSAESLLLPRSSQSFSSLGEMAQVSGRVVDENGNGFPGVNILVKGTSIGAVTDINGNYTIAVPDNGTVLVFSFVGYSSQGGLAEI